MKKIIVALFFLTISFSVTAQEPSVINTLCCGNSITSPKVNSLKVALENKDTITALDLSMQEVKLTTIPVEVAGLKNLLCLDVSFNRIASIPPEIKQLSRLRCIDLSGNNYLQTLPDWFNEMENLQVVRLVDMHLWKDAKKEELKKKFPKLILVF